MISLLPSPRSCASIPPLHDHYPIPGRFHDAFEDGSGYHLKSSPHLIHASTPEISDISAPLSSPPSLYAMLYHALLVVPRGMGICIIIPMHPMGSSFPFPRFPILISSIRRRDQP
jgi:hypothetical protein